jgi:disulfide bond formation protein DsbB
MHRLVALISPQRGFAFIGIGAIALVVVSVVLTGALDLAPCPLCIFQRMLYLLLAALALTAAAWPRLRLGAGTLALVVTLGGLTTAAYQSWIQAYPPTGLSCGPGNPGLIEQLVYWAGAKVQWLFTAWGDCTRREWALLGLSIANWSALAFLGFTAALALLLHAAVRAHRIG